MMHVVVDEAELTRQALAADPDTPVAEDAVPFDRSDTGFALLPEWYMPAPMLRRSRGRVIGLALLAMSLFVGTIGGFCVTYGLPEFVWR